jgi:hypothetical protein
VAPSLGALLNRNNDMAMPSIASTRYDEPRIFNHLHASLAISLRISATLPKANPTMNDERRIRSHMGLRSRATALLCG